MQCALCYCAQARLIAGAAGKRACARTRLSQLLNGCRASAAAVAGQLLPPDLAMLCHLLLLLLSPFTKQPSLSSSLSCAPATCWVMRWRMKRRLMRFMWAQVRLWFCHTHALLRFAR